MKRTSELHKKDINSRQRSYCRFFLRRM